MTLLNRNLAWLVSLIAVAYGARDYRVLAAGRQDGVEADKPVLQASVLPSDFSVSAPMAPLAMRGPIGMGVVVPSPVYTAQREELRDAPRDTAPARPRKETKARLTDKDIRAAAKSVIVYKNRPWTVSEYNAENFYTAISLREKGASADQMRLFQRIIDEAPGRNGGYDLPSGE